MKSTPVTATNMPLTLVVSEVFYSLQGEGGRAGEPSLFVRLSGCSAKHACAASGVVCDTEFESGKRMDLSKLEQLMMAAIEAAITPMSLDGQLPWIVWTGGEPLDQLTVPIIHELQKRGWTRQALETSGVVPMEVELRHALTYVTISPKVAEHILLKHFPWTQVHPVDELRYVRHSGQPGVPVPSLAARRYLLSPHSDGFTINPVNVQHCTRLCLENPKWSLSVQQHKVWKVL